MQHWQEGKPWLHLDVVLKDWPSNWYNGAEQAKYNTIYHQWRDITVEFLKESVALSLPCSPTHHSHLSQLIQGLQGHYGMWSHHSSK